MPTDANQPPIPLSSGWTFEILQRDGFTNMAQAIARANGGDAHPSIKARLSAPIRAGDPRAAVVEALDGYNHGDPAAQATFLGRLYDLEDVFTALLVALSEAITLVENNTGILDSQPSPDEVGDFQPERQRKRYFA